MYTVRIGDVVYTVRIGDVVYTVRVGDVVYTVRVGDVVYIVRVGDVVSCYHALCSLQTQTCLASQHVGDADDTSSALAPPSGSQQVL